MENQENKKYTFDRTVRLILNTLLIVGIFFLFKILSPYLISFLIALLVAYLLNPIIKFLQKKVKIKNRSLAVSVTLILVFGVLTGATILIIPAIGQEVIHTEELAVKYVQQQNKPDWFPENINETIQQYLQSDEAKQYLNYENLSQYAYTILGNIWKGIIGVGGFLFSLFSLVTFLLYLVFIMIYYDDFTKNWEGYIPEKWRNQLVGIVEDVESGMQVYFRSQAKIVMIVSILFAVGFKIIGLPLGIGLGILVGLFNFVPYMQWLGVPLAAFLALLYSLETGSSFWVMMGLVLLVMGIVQLIQEVVLTPKIMGNSMGLNPAIILLSLSIWGGLLGIIGMVIALPITSLMIAYYRRFVLKAS
ncbi:MAG: AI-2E family transporter [Bacteroidales bacterium]|nr:AI-2E family transporter [Bacteroidales bacterium]